MKILRKVLTGFIALVSLANFAYSANDITDPIENLDGDSSRIGYVQEIVIDFDAILPPNRLYTRLGQSVSDEELMEKQEGTVCFVNNQGDHQLNFEKGDRLIPGFYGPIKVFDMGPMMGIDKSLLYVSIIALHEKTNKYVFFECRTLQKQYSEPSLEDVRTMFETIAKVSFSKYSLDKKKTALLIELDKNEEEANRKYEEARARVCAFLPLACGKD